MICTSKLTARVLGYDGPTMDDTADILALCAEVERLQNALHQISKDLLCDTSDSVMADLSQFAWRVIDGSASVDPTVAQGLAESRRIMREEIARRRNEHTD